MKMHFSIGVVGGMLLMANSYAASPVAHLQQISGVVLVSQSDGFSTASEGMALAQGDRVMVMEDGAASLVYPNGCQVVYTGGQLVTVEPGCKAGKSQATNPMYTVTGAAAGAGAGLGAGTGAVAAGTVMGIATPVVVAGAVATTVAVAAATGGFDGSDASGGN